MNIIQNNLSSTKTPFPLPKPMAQAIGGGLKGLVDIDGGPTLEQTRILNALATHILGFDMSSISKSAAIAPAQLAGLLPDPKYQRIFM